MSLQLAREEPEAGPWRVESLTAVIGALIGRGSGRVVSGRPVVLAIDGRSNAGKTTLAARICRAAPGSAVVHTDDIAWQHSRFGWADLLDDGILTPARQVEPVAYRPPPRQDHGRPACLTVPAGCSLLSVGGVGPGRIETAGLIDALIWVQADQDEA